VTVVVFALVALAVLGLLVLVHRWLWIRLVRDVQPRAAWRHAGTAAAFALPLLSLGALVSGRAGAPFWLQQALAWPGYFWLALLLYLSLALAVAEPVRALWLRRPAADAAEPSGRAEPEPEPEREQEREAREVAVEPVPAPVPAALPETDADGGGPRSATEPAATTGAAAGAPAAWDPETATTTGTGPGSGSGGGLAVTSDGTGVPRRVFVARVLAGAAVAAAGGTVAYGTYGVMRGPRVKRVRVPLAKLPRAAHGFRIAVVSDVHLGPVLGRAHTQRVVDAVNGTQPDLVAIVGDLVDGDVADLAGAAEPLARLRSRHGTYFVTGNHEYFSGAQQWVDHVRELGLRPLENARTALPAFDLAGVNDVAGEREGQGPDFARALGDRDRSRAAVLLAHQPIVIHDAVAHGVDLQLSGHTHGGQLWPGEYLAAAANPTVAGLERYGDTQLYVSRGAGAWGPPVRVGAPSDITVVELASYQS
jgi:predicted MPP superfamily phosphohydrolase